MLLQNYKEEIKWNLVWRTNHNISSQDSFENLKKMANLFKFQSISILAIHNNRRHYSIVFSNKLVDRYFWVFTGAKTRFSFLKWRYFNRGQTSRAVFRFISGDFIDNQV